MALSPVGPLYPGTAVDGGGGNQVWSNPGNVSSVNATNATVGFPGGGDGSNYLFAKNFGFSIPSTAVIEGIQVEYLRKGINAACGSVKLTKASNTPVGAELADYFNDFWPSSLGWFTYGGATELWGTTWTPAEINSTNFGVGISSYNTHGGGSGEIDAIRITVWWRTAPADVPKRYLYKVSSNGQYIGNLPNVRSDFSVSQDINTAGGQISIECAMTIDTPNIATDFLTDESSTQLTDEAGVDFLTMDAVQPVVALGVSGTGALIKNGNTIEVWEYSFYYPNGKCMFRGIMEKWQASIGTDSSDIVQILCYSDGQDLDNYLIRGYPYTYTGDQTQTSTNTTVLVSQAGMGAGHDRFGQKFTTGSGQTNIGAINLLLTGTANVTVKLYDNESLSTLLGTSSLSVAAAGATEFQFAFPTTLAVTGSTTYFFTIEVDAGQSITVSASSANPYAGGQTYESLFGGAGGGAYSAVSGYDLWFKTFSGTGSTTGSFSSADPTTGMYLPFMQDYAARGGLISFSTPATTGLSLSYTFNTNTILEGVKAVRDMAPDGWYYYLDMGLNKLFLKQVNTTADIVLTKGRHIESLQLAATIENVKNQVFFTGGDTGSGTNLYKTYQDPASVSLYRPRLDRKSDNRVTVTATADAIGGSALSEQKDEGFATTVSIPDKTMDITLVKPGMTIGFNGFGTFVDSLILQIVRVTYTPEEVTVSLGLIPPRLSQAVEQVTRGLLAQQTVANPSTPS